MKTNKGFTVVELIVVGFIIGILVAFAIPKFLEFKEKYQTKQPTAIIEQVQPNTNELEKLE